MLKRHAETLRNAEQFEAVEPGYLNYCEPPIEEAIMRCADSGANHVVIVPYFLVAGKFVLEDLPGRLKTAILPYPHIRFSVAEPLGASESMLHAAVQLLSTATSPLKWQAQAIAEAQRLCELRSNCPVYGTALCRKGQVNG